MRHGKKFNHLSRTTSHRKAMLANMACSLIEHKRINTTLAKAKALRGFVEPLITKSKTDSTHSRRLVFSSLKNKYAVTELFREVAPKIADRPGGYTRIIRTGNRLGDNAEMCLIELVDFNTIYGAETAKKTTRRSRRGGKGEGETTTDAPATKKPAAKKTDKADDAVTEAKPEAKTKTEDKPKAKKDDAPKAKSDDAADAKSEEEE